MISLASITAGVSTEESKQRRDAAATYLAKIQETGAAGMELLAAQGYLDLCDLVVEYIGEQLAWHPR